MLKPILYTYSRHREPNEIAEGGGYRLLEIFTKVQYEVIDGAGSGINVVPPYCLQFFLRVARHHSLFSNSSFSNIASFLLS